MSDLDTKNGIPFEAETEYLYQKKIEDLTRELDSMRKTLLLQEDVHNDELDALLQHQKALKPFGELLSWINDDDLLLKPVFNVTVTGKAVLDARKLVRGDDLKKENKHD